MVSPEASEREAVSNLLCCIRFTAGKMSACGALACILGFMNSCADEERLKHDNVAVR